MIEYLVGGAILAAFGWFLKENFSRMTKLKTISAIVLAGAISFGSFTTVQKYSDQYDRTNYLSVATAALQQRIEADENLLAIELWEARGTDYHCVALAGIPLCDVGDEKYPIAAAAYVSVNIERNGFHGVRLRPYNKDGSEHWSKPEYDAIIAVTGVKYKDFEVNGEIIRKEVFPYFVYFNVDGDGAYRLTMVYSGIGDYGVNRKGKIAFNLDSWKIGEEPREIRHWIDSLRQILTLGTIDE